jgi:hypothetical protein
MHLPNRQPIPSNSIGHNLKEKINAWLAGSVAAVPPNPSNPMFNRDPPPHATHCFEIVTKALYSLLVQEAHIVEVPLVGEENESDDEDANLFEVFAAERKRRNAKATQLPELAQAKEAEEIITPTAASSKPISKSPPIVTPPKLDSSSKNKPPPSMPLTNDPSHPTFSNEPLHSSTSRTMPQYCYLSNAEDQQLTAELFKWLLDGKLSLITPAHVLAASPSIRKELIEQLKTCRVDTGGYDVPSILKPVPPSSVLKLSTPRPAKYSHPLREIDVLVNGIVPEAGILDQGSQIIVIRWDLAREAEVQFNPNFQLEMEGANGLSSKTMGCAKNLTMQIGDVSFEVHTHIVERALFRLLLGRPFHHHLLCQHEDHSDRRVDVSVHDPANPAHSFTIPSRARKAQVGFVKALAFSLPLSQMCSFIRF